MTSLITAYVASFAAMIIGNSIDAANVMLNIAVQVVALPGMLACAMLPLRAQNGTTRPPRKIWEPHTEDYNLASSPGQSTETG
ncbi:hypothetical protein A5686_15315 [Mycobacterium sp. E2479]|nr:hypothetical protein A5686_15315 [Mycobacterium sp. E2479]